jgi:hypothetical protein
MRNLVDSPLHETSPVLRDEPTTHRADAPNHPQVRRPIDARFEA